MTALVRGANAQVASGEQPGLVIGVRWNLSEVECDLCALVCDSRRRALSDKHLVFFNNPASPDGAVVLRQVEHGSATEGDRAQVQVYLPGLPQQATQVVVALATLEPESKLDDVSNLDVTVFDPRDGEIEVTYTVGPEKSGTACLILVELYRHSGAWKVRAVGQGYDTGLRGLSIDYGISVE